MIVAQRLRKGACGSPRGAARLVADALKTVAHDCAGHGRGPVAGAGGLGVLRPTPPSAPRCRAGADVSVTVRLDPRVKKAIAAIADDAWTTIEYTDAVFDEDHRRVDLPGRGRRDRLHRVRLPEARPTRCPAGWWCAASPTSTPSAEPPGRTPCSTPGGSTPSSPPPTPTVLDTVAADKTHRGHAIIEQVHADLKNSALAHLPSGKFTANAAWLVLAVIAFNLTRAAAALAGPDLAKATTATIRRKLIPVPARIATSARRLTLHLPHAGPGRPPGATCSTSLSAETLRSIT